MSHLPYSHDQLVRLAHLTHADITEINQRRHPHNRLGFAYQLAFVRLFNRFPSQVALTPLPELLTFISVQLAIPADAIVHYATRQQTISDHQEHIRRYLHLRRFGAEESQLVQQFLFDEACRLEQTSALLARAEQFLVTQRILTPAQDTLVRLIARQRDQARQHIYQRIHAALTVAQQHQLDQLIVVDDGRHSWLHTLKEPPRRASPQAILRLLDHLEQIEATGILTIDLSWLNNNYQRALTRYATRCSANRLRNLQASHRYATLTCFLWQTYQDTIDYILDMHTKLVTSVYHHAEK